MHVAVGELRVMMKPPPPEVARALHPPITRPFSKKRTVPATEVVTEMVTFTPLTGVADKVMEMVGVAIPTVMVIG